MFHTSRVSRKVFYTFHSPKMLAYCLFTIPFLGLLNLFLLNPIPSLPYSFLTLFFLTLFFLTLFRAATITLTCQGRGTASAPSPRELLGEFRRKRLGSLRVVCGQFAGGLRAVRGQFAGCSRAVCGWFAGRLRLAVCERFSSSMQAVIGRFAVGGLRLRLTKYTPRDEQNATPNPIKLRNAQRWPSSSYSKALESDASAGGESPVRAPVRAATLCLYA